MAITAAPTIQQVTAESQAIISKLLQQRNDALDEVVRLHGGLALRDLEIAVLVAAQVKAEEPVSAE